MYRPRSNVLEGVRSLFNILCVVRRSCSRLLSKPDSIRQSMNSFAVWLVDFSLRRVRTGKSNNREGQERLVNASSSPETDYVNFGCEGSFEVTDGHGGVFQLVIDQTESGEERSDRESERELEREAFQNKIL